MATKKCEILEKLRNFHPHKEPCIVEAVQEAECASPGLTEDDDDVIRHVIKQFSEASGGGPSQLLPNHLKEAITCDV